MFSTIIDQKILELVCKEYTNKVLVKILDLAKEKNQIGSIDQLDKHGYALIHYFSLINYHEAIQLLAENGANLNLRVKNSKNYPLYIAAAKGHERTVSVLIQNGANLNNKE